MNTLPFQNVAYASINSIGKQWIRRFALALTKEVLGQIRGKFSSIPIPGEAVSLNSAELLSQAKSEQEALREELKTTLDELTYSKLAEQDGVISDSAEKVLSDIPTGIYVG
jgi:ssDNA-specific exonuclease RecJ